MQRFAEQLSSPGHAAAYLLVPNRPESDWGCVCVSMYCQLCTTRRRQPVRRLHMHMFPGATAKPLPISAAWPHAKLACHAGSTAQPTAQSMLCKPPTCCDPDHVCTQNAGRPHHPQGFLRCWPPCRSPAACTPQRHGAHASGLDAFSSPVNAMLFIQRHATCYLQAMSAYESLVHDDC